MEWFSRKTSIAGVQVPNWMVVLGHLFIHSLTRPLVAGDATTRNKLDPIETKALRPQKRTPSSLHAWGFLK
jgi:hypothetical protein